MSCTYWEMWLRLAWSKQFTIWPSLYCILLTQKKKLTELSHNQKCNRNRTNPRHHPKKIMAIMNQLDESYQIDGIAGTCRFMSSTHLTDSLRDISTRLLPTRPPLWRDYHTSSYWVSDGQFGGRTTDFVTISHFSCLLPVRAACTQPQSSNRCFL